MSAAKEVADRLPAVSLPLAIRRVRGMLAAVGNGEDMPFPRGENMAALRVVLDAAIARPRDGGER